MTETVTTQQAIDAIERERAHWEGLVAEADTARMEEPGVTGSYSFKDLAGHLTGWLAWEIDRIEAAVRGEKAKSPWPEDLDTDGINAWMHAHDRVRTLTDTLEDATGIYGRLEAIVRAIPADRLNDPAAFPWIEDGSLGQSLVSGHFFSHLGEEHEPGIRAWLNGAA